MPKARMLRPDFWTDERVVALSPLARLLFLGMWNYACDNGHVDDSVLQLKIRILPGDNADAGALLDEVLASGMVVRRDGCLKVINLSKKQPLDLRFLVFCDHCQDDADRHYHDADKKAPRRAPTGHTRAPRVQHDERTTGTRRSGDGDGDVKDVVGARKRGTRIPDDFPLTAEMRTWAETNAEWADVDREHAKFCDYWAAKTGQAATKLDWNKTWRNWLRRASDETPAWKRTTSNRPRELSQIYESDLRPFDGDPDDVQGWAAHQRAERARIRRERGEVA